MNTSNQIFALADTPTTPLPNPGEGGAVFPGNGSGSNGGNTGSGNGGSGGSSSGGNVNMPVIPLPNPGEGGAVFPGNNGANNGSGGGNNSGNSTGGNAPVIPLPNPGEGGAVYPGTPNQVIPILPLPNLPCFFCNDNSNGQVRFLNGAVGYQPFRVIINRRLITSSLDFAGLTTYGAVSSGFQTVTITGQDGYIYIQKTIPFKAGEKNTIAIINTANGLDLLQIDDTPCNKASNISCFRAINLAYYSNPLDLILYDGRIVYSDIRYKEVTVFKRIQPGAYSFYLAETELQPLLQFEDIETLDSARITAEIQEALLSFYMDVKPNCLYTVYILNWNPSASALQTLIVEDTL